MTDALALLPQSADKQAWNPQQTALMESLGLRGEKNVKRGSSWTKETFEAPQSIVEAFLYQIRRTGLDPVARQIYCIERGGKWGIQASIDGFRLIAERSKEYTGQTPVQWTADGVTWLDVWLATTPPAAARVGIYRRGFTEPVWAVATYSGYVPRDRDGNAKPSGQWAANSSNQLAKCAEMLGLRKAFPQDLSGIYGTEEMDQAAPAKDAPEPARRPEPPAPTRSRDWVGLASRCRDRDTLRALYAEAESAGELNLAATDGPDGPSVKQVFWQLREHLPEPDVTPAEETKSDDDVVDAEVVEEPVTEWPTATPGEGNPDELI
ncbi:recombinase RecT [Humibacter sp. RRB41]|uniref:recombinase RecT n=1 Tax=Humibacter sp. RRB41 TaxID=2919946 RepID=UPI001FA943D1|nr:recombinase RecT [Humibacter sp. RRB41]